MVTNSKQQKAIIKEWISQKFHLDSSFLILLSEKECTEKADHITTIVLILKDCADYCSKVFTIEKCLFEINEMDISNLLEEKLPLFQRQNLVQPCTKLFHNLFNRS